MVERVNRTVQDMLAKAVSLDQKDWDLQLPLLMMAYNNTPHETTRMTPFSMMFGGNMTLPIEATTGKVKDPEDRQKNSYEYVEWLKNALKLTHEAARKAIKKNVIIQKRHYDRNVQERVYNIGDQVRLYQREVKQGRKTALERFWTGPWIITEKYSEVIMEIGRAHV